MYLFRFLNTPLGGGEGAATQTFAPGGKYPRAATARSFKVIRFDVNEEPLRGYIIQYNNCGHEYEALEDIANE